MSLKLNLVSNGNLYVNGNNHAGKIKEFEIPSITQTTAEQKGLGMLGTLEVPTGVEKMEAKINFNSIYKDFSYILNPQRAVDLQIRANVETHTSAGTISQEPLVIFMKGRSKSAVLGSIKAQEVSAETECTYAIHSIRIEIAGVKMFEFDVLSGVYFAENEDIARTFRANLGL
jgi:uncharacterized protein